MLFLISFGITWKSCDWGRIFYLPISAGAFYSSSTEVKQSKARTTRCFFLCLDCRPLLSWCAGQQCRRKKGVMAPGSWSLLKNYCYAMLLLCIDVLFRALLSLRLFPINFLPISTTCMEGWDTVVLQLCLKPCSNHVQRVIWGPGRLHVTSLGLGRP